MFQGVSKASSTGGYGPKRDTVRIPATPAFTWERTFFHWSRALRSSYN